MLSAINVPLVLFAVGYNRFRGQSDFDPVFYDHIEAVARKAVYLGLRNHGSIESLKGYLPEPLHEKLRFQPCMTTLLARLYPELIPERTQRPRTPVVAVNCAFDRVFLRYGDRVAEILNTLARVLKNLGEQVTLQYYAHSYSDLHFLPFLDSQQVRYQTVRLYDMPATEIIRAYSRPSLVLGMRGHAQMIPFGCQVPIVSLITHDKLKWFLDDIGKPEWAVEMTDPDFADRLERAIDQGLSENKLQIEQIRQAQNDLWTISMENVNIAREAFGLEPLPG